MKIFNEIKLIENFLLGKLTTPSRLLFEARLLIDPVLSKRVKGQEKLYSVIRQSGRRKIRAEIDKTHHLLFNDPEKERFRQQVHQLFQKK
jgi:hypothetical protein